MHRTQLLILSYDKATLSIMDMIRAGYTYNKSGIFFLSPNGFIKSYVLHYSESPDTVRGLRPDFIIIDITEEEMKDPRWHKLRDAIKPMLVSNPIIDDKTNAMGITLPNGYSVDNKRLGYEPMACEHDWALYEGFTETYQYCTKCDEKKYSL